MKLFKIIPESYSWDNYDSCVIIAPDIETVKGMMVHDDVHHVTRVGDDDIGVFFEDMQGSLSIIEINMERCGTCIISASFNAG